MPLPAQAPPSVDHRLRAVLLHVPYFSTEGPARLAVACGVARSTISRLLRGRVAPTYQLAQTIAGAISQRHGKSIDLRELFTTDGTYPTPSTCELMGCKGCLPPEAWDERTDRLKPAWRHQKPGEWSRQQADPTSPGPSI